MTTAVAGRGLTLSRFAIILFILVGVYILWDNWLPRTPADDFPINDDAAADISQATAASPPPNASEPALNETSPSPSTPPQSFSESCRSAPGAENIMVLLKTGATELYQKLPTHFLTTFTCVPHFMIFSDLAQQFGDVDVHDAIAPVSWVYREHHWDFELYRKLQHYHAEGQDMGHLQGDGGWNLDKWKFLPMLHRAFENAGDNIDWFVVLEADTSLAWGNLLAWLKTMDPRKPYYLGAQNVIGTTTFAHGGSGFIVSRKAADMLEDARHAQGQQAFDEDWEEALSTACCGDEVIARTLAEAAGVPLTPAWPIIQGETVASIDWTPNHWCRPAVSWHHVTPIEIDAMFQFQAGWVEEHGWEQPFLHRDVFEHFVQRHVVGVNRTAWDNLSRDVRLASAALATGDDKPVAAMEEFERAATESQDACAEACVRMGDGECIQWMFSPGRCHLGRDIRFGRSDEREAVEERWVSGWIAERIESFKRGFEDCDTTWKGVGAEGMD